MTDADVRLLMGLLPFAAATSFTPGPNNLMLASTGAAFGFVRTIPQQLGVVAGFAVMTLVIGAGLATFLTSAPGLLPALRTASVAYILFLAWRISTSHGPADAGAAKPMSFLGMAAFQWMNPKGWTMALSALPAFTTSPTHALRDALLITVGFAVVGMASSVS